MTKVNLKTLAANAARAKQRLLRQETKLQNLTRQLIERVGTGGQTIQTTLGQVVVTAQTYDRNADGYIMTFNEDAFMNLKPELQLELVKAGVVVTQKKLIRGTAPRVQFRLVETK